MVNPVPVSLWSLSSEVPEHSITQNSVLEHSDALFGDRFADYEKLRPIFENSGIRKRHLSMPLDWYLNERDFSDRTTAYLEAANKLFAGVTSSVLEEAELLAKDIDVVVVASSTGIATPTLDARVASQIGFRPDIVRVPLFGMGCAGGVAGLAVAAKMAQSQPGSKVLFVTIELCTLSFRIDQFTKANLVATALFGDGAAAAIVSTTPNDAGIQLGAAKQHTWPDTLGIMGWNVDPIGFEVIFDRDIPPFARRHLQPVLAGFLKELDLERQDISRLTFHPGGARVIEAIEGACDLSPGALDIERHVLSEYGNMSAPTALFVLKQSIESGLKGRSLVSALGPGFTVASLPLEVLH
ncbi:MAG: type III polyketide synthase [Pseudomonadota bacterium]